MHSQSELHKGIANNFNKATAFCNAPTRVINAPGFSLHKRSFVQRKARSPIYAGRRVAKSCCFIESIGNTFAQRWSATTAVFGLRVVDASMMPTSSMILATRR
jgi:hypothetical protein